jgi:hypothetical protein
VEARSENLIGATRPVHAIEVRGVEPAPARNEGRRARTDSGRTGDANRRPLTNRPLRIPGTSSGGTASSNRFGAGGNRRSEYG